MNTIYTQVTLLARLNEVNAAGVSADFIRYFDTAQFRYVGLAYDYGASQWKVYNDVGDIVLINEVVHADVAYAFQLNFIKNATTGLITVNVVRGATLAGTL